MSKSVPLEELAELRKEDFLKDNLHLGRQCRYVVIEKYLKAIEIIKRDPIEVVNIIETYDSYRQMVEDYYSYCYIEPCIKDEYEFNLLKEVLL